ncbi:MAG: hypothetical protein AB7E80_05920 [Hyphomicrobiaceae bacterium]
MTTIDAAATFRASGPLANLTSYARSAACAVAVAALGLAGCETGSNLLGQAGPAGPATELAAPAPQPGAAKLAIAPVIGAPDTVAKQMQASLGSALSKRSIAVAQAGDKSDYTLRGYVVSAREKTGVKVSYIWDVTDAAGQRLNRITGEEVLANAQSRDPWTAVSNNVIETISTKTATQIAAFMPTLGRPGTPAAAAVPVAAAPVTSAGARTAGLQPTAGATTGSIGRDGPVATFVPNVSGAPGDGRISLTSALQRELSRSGVSLANANGGATYRVEGVVEVGTNQDGKQPIKIDWHVKDPAGKRIGTVSQKNEIAAGSLDGAWGATADAAAAAAAQGILKLLPKQN